MRSHHLVFVLSGLFILASMPIDAIAKAAPKRSAQKSGSYTQTTTPSAGGYTHTVTSRPAPPATIKYSDGVVVKRCADGSVEVSDPDSGRMQSFDGGYVAPRRAVKRQAVRRKAK